MHCEANSATTTGGIDRLRAHDFRRLAKFIHDYSGIKMPQAKQTMVEGRLRKRVGATGFGSLDEYCRYLFDEGGLATEAIHLIDVVTTNKTDFFREPDHFKYLADFALPRLLSERRAGGNTLVKAWSTASSIGAEPYTMAMVMDDLSHRLGGFRINIVATDISTRVLETAAGAVYPEAMIAPVPLDMRKRYLLRGRNRSQGLVRLVPEIRRLVHFGRLNLMDAAYPVDQDMDVIFCRNMLIYFDKPTQQSVLTRLCDHLRPGGCLFLGHSESLAGFGLPLNPIAPTVFRRG
jgi:chemotaxis protein methyltransferase CheR